MSLDLWLLVLPPSLCLLPQFCSLYLTFSSLALGFPVHLSHHAGTSSAERCAFPREHIPDPCQPAADNEEY